MQVKENIISNGHGVCSPQYLVIHETANPGATALNHVSYWSSGGADYMAHYVMDWNGIAYHCCPDNRICWHVGNANGFTVGIELCHATNSTQFNQVWDNAVEFAAWYLKKKGWGTSRLLSHAYCSSTWGGSDHTDPIGYFNQFGRTWNQFITAVSSKMKGHTVNKQKPGKAVNNNGFYYRAHVANLGWLDSVRDGQVAGTVGNAYAMEAFKIKPPEGMELNVKAHIANVGWKTYKGIKAGQNSGTGSSPNDPIIGTTGKKQGIEAFEIDIVKNPKNFKVQYKCHISGFGWTGWIDAGYACGTVGINHSIEAIQIKAV